MRAKAKQARDDLLAAVPAWVIARVLVLGSLAFAHLLARRLQTLPTFSMRHLDEGLLGWDAVRYEQIARFGYQALPQQELRFFPLLPMLARPLGWVLGGRYGVALLVVSSAAALGFAALLHRLVVAETGDRALGRRATWVVAMAPAAFVLVWGYSESVAGALTAGGLLALRRKAWWWAAVLGVLLGLTRPVGLLFMVPAAVEAARGFRVRELGRRAAAVVAPAVGAALYCAWVWRVFGDATIPFDVQRQENFRGPILNPLRPLGTAVANAVTGRWEGNALHLPWVVLAVVLVVVCARRWPLSYTALAAATVLVALSARRWGSFERYAFTSVPMVLAAASAFRTEHRERAMLVVAAAAMAAYNLLALLGSYVP